MTPHIQVFASGDAIANYQFHPAAPRNGVLIYYGIDVAFATVSQRGKPRMDYPRYSVVLPDNISEEEAVRIFRQNFAQRRSVIYSYDDAGQGDLSDITAELRGISIERQDEFRMWFDVYYPGVKVVFA